MKTANQYLFLVSLFLLFSFQAIGKPFDIDLDFCNRIISKDLDQYHLEEAYIGQTFLLSEAKNELQRWGEGLVVDDYGDPLSNDNNQNLIVYHFEFNDFLFMFLTKNNEANQEILVDALIVRKLSEVENIYYGPINIDGNTTWACYAILNEKLSSETANIRKIIRPDIQKEQFIIVNWDEAVVYSFF